MQLRLCYGDVMRTPAVAWVAIIALVIGIPAPAFAGSEARSPTIVVAADLSAPATDWIRADGTRLVDGQGRQFLPRGFVTITNNSDGSAVSYTVNDFRRMRAMGANHHTLRIHAASLGVIPNLPANPFYLLRLDAAVARAKEAGLYTVFKLAMYDTPLYGSASWGSLWANQNGEQAAVLNAWRLIWERYKDEPAVLGYDLLNEPELGTLEVTYPTFVANHLTPFYRAAIDQLRTIDQRHLAYFQPPKLWLNYPTALERPQAVYAPHYYPNLMDYLNGDFSTTQYAPLLQIFRAQAQWLGAPLVIGEYGMPWFKGNDGNATVESQYQAQEKLAGSLMDASGLGFTRPWFSDDRAEHYWAELGILLNWALFQGSGGLGGPERRFITDAVVRPYPQLLSGTSPTGGFTYDHATRQFSLAYTPTAGGHTEVFTPRARHYAGGFQVRYTGGLVLAYDAAAPSGLRVVANPGGLDAGAFAWDEARQALTIGEWLTGQPVTLEVLPS
jgi:hypothetical protein